MAAGAPPELVRIANRARAFLQPAWLRWHAAAGEAQVEIASRGTCGRSSLFLQRTLAHAGHAALWRNGIPLDGRRLGFFDGSRWHGHAWVEAEGWHVDITADQFGAPPVLVVRNSDGRYAAGGPDTATPEAIANRLQCVEDIWPAWLELSAAA